MRSAIRDLIASFPVYRTYIHEGQITERDRRVVHLAVATARRRNPAADAVVLHFLRDVLLLEQPPELDAAGLEERDFFIGRFQQVSSPVMAKGVEDTAFYRYVPLASLEEVGGEPAHAAISVSEFHRQNTARFQEWPRCMLATSTHDTKRSEDLRARLNVLSEIPGDWQKAVSRWTRINRKFHRDVDGMPAPSRNDEWLFYQSLLGAWPLHPPGEEELAELISRLQGYMEKATREAKLSTSWISPNAAYDEAMRGFVAEVLSSANGRFVSDFAAFHESIVESGLFNSLSQVTLKLTAPGFPDIYQGQELWDFSLVDPDNRRPVDYPRRRELLDEILRDGANAGSRLEMCRQLTADPRQDKMKLFVTTTLLQLRKRLPGVFGDGEYLPLDVEGERAEHIAAFARRSRERPEEVVIVVVPRLIHRMLGGVKTAPCGDVWGETSVVVNIDSASAVWHAFTGERFEISGARLRVAEILGQFPVATLTSDADNMASN